MRKLLFMLVAGLLLLSLVGCGAKSEAKTGKPYYEDAASFEAALNAGEDVIGATVRFTVVEFVPDSAFGYNLQAGEHLNFCSERDPKAQPGDIVTAEITKVSSVLGSYIISYRMTEIVSAPPVEPTPAPALRETAAPTAEPTAEPTVEPTAAPTEIPAEERAPVLPTIEEQVIYEGHGVVITAKGLEKTGSNWNVKLLIENNSNLNLGFNAHAYAVNGIMTRESIYAMDCDVAAGKKVNAQLTLKGRFLQQFGIEDSEIGCIDVLFWAYDNDKYFKEFDTGQLEIKTSLYNGVHDRLVADTVFSESGISVDYVKSDRDEYTFAVSNDTGKYVSFTFDEISVNDYTVSSTDYDLYNETLLDGCQILCIVKVKSDFKEANGITTVQTLDWNIEIEPEDDWREEYKLGPVVYRVK